MGGVLLALIFLPIVFLFYVYCVNFLYIRMFRRKKSYYDELLYLMTCILVISAVINSVISFLPLQCRFICWIPIIYGLVLNVIAVKSIISLKIWESVLTVVIGAILAMGGLICIPLFMISMLNSIPRMF